MRSSSESPFGRANLEHIVCRVRVDIVHGAQLAGAAAHRAADQVDVEELVPIRVRQRRRRDAHFPATQGLGSVAVAREVEAQDRRSLVPRRSRITAAWPPTSKLGAGRSGTTPPWPSMWTDPRGRADGRSFPRRSVRRARESQPAISTCTRRPVLTADARTIVRSARATLPACRSPCRRRPPRRTARAPRRARRRCARPARRPDGRRARAPGRPAAPPCPTRRRSSQLPHGCGRLRAPGEPLPGPVGVDLDERRLGLGL